MSYSQCNCYSCEQARDRAKRKVEEKHVRLSEARALVERYYSDPKAFMDLKNMKPHNGRDDSFVVSIKTFEEATGLRKLGAGCYSIVYALNATKVLKIVKNRDEGYARFVDFVKAFGPSPYLPRIYYSGTWGGKQVYILERLEASNSCDQERLNSQFCEAMHSGDNPFIKHSTTEIEKLAKAMQAENLLMDLGGNNLLFRGDTPVISDPAC